jgi:hypothetical protein
MMNYFQILKDDFKNDRINAIKPNPSTPIKIVHRKRGT